LEVILFPRRPNVRAPPTILIMKSIIPTLDITSQGKQNKKI